ncbi:TPA: hypothetical protein ACH3X2_009509, partial [Trebouxia sp. C0005]
DSLIPTLLRPEFVEVLSLLHEAAADPQCHWNSFRGRVVFSKVKLGGCTNLDSVW